MADLFGMQPGRADTEQRLADARWIRDYLRRRGYAPTLDEMAVAWAVVKSCVHNRLRVLRGVGLVSFENYKRQTLRAFPPDPAGRRRAYFEVVPALTEAGIERAELRYLGDG